jgi:hypothetical protein
MSIESLSYRLNQLGLVRVGVFLSASYEEDRDDQKGNPYKRSYAIKVIIMIHIDDILLIGKNRTVIELFKQDLRALFNVMDLDEAADDLVMKIKQNAADESRIWQQFDMCHMPCKAHTHTRLDIAYAVRLLPLPSLTN